MFNESINAAVVLNAIKAEVGPHTSSEKCAHFFEGQSWCAMETQFCKISHKNSIKMSRKIVITAKY